MKRLVLGFVLVVVGTGLWTPAAQAAPTLTMNEAKMAVFQHGFKLKNGYFAGARTFKKCSRLASNRIRCAVKLTIDFYSAPKTCRGRVEVVEQAEIKVRTLSRTCRKSKARYGSAETAMKAALKAMAPEASDPDREMGMSSGHFGKNRHSFEVTWVGDNKEICLQTAKVRFVNKKVRVKVSEVACVDDPGWP